jgi:dolichyl-phosphate-mannose--protein O-mannosyl transferase
MVIVRESPSVPGYLTARTALIAVILFLGAHLLLLVGVTTPDKFYFDEVHYVPAARQMLEPVMPSPMLNPMHPPLAKQMIALSIRVFGDDRSVGVIQRRCSAHWQSWPCISAASRCSRRRGPRLRRR